MPNRFLFGSLLILLLQGWSSFPFRCGSTVIGPDSGAAWESQQVLWGGPTGVEPVQEGNVWLPPVTGRPHIANTWIRTKISRPRKPRLLPVASCLLVGV